MGFPAVRVVSLVKNEDVYHLKSLTKLKGVASLLGFGPIHESSTFIYESGGIRPLLYLIGENKPDDSKDIRIEFDWEKKQSKSTAKGELFDFPISFGMQDPLTFELMARLNLEKGLKNFSFSVHEGSRVRNYSFIRENEESILIADKTIRGVRYFIDRQSSRQLFYWFSPKYLYLTLKIQQLHNDKIKGTVLLENSTVLK